MAFLATGVMEVRGGAGSDTNGGGWDTTGTGTDWSQQNAAQYSVNDCVTAGTTTLVSATANFGTDVPGNYCLVVGGTAALAAVWRRIVSRTNATTIVVDSATGLGAGTGATLKIGGAFNTISAAEAIKVAGNDIHIKAATYAELVTITIAGTNGAQCRYLGYNATRGDNPVGVDRPLIDAAGARANCITHGAVSGLQFFNLRGAGGTAANFNSTGSVAVWKNCKSSGSATDGWKVTTGNCRLFKCESSGHTGVGVNAAGSGTVVISGCYIHDNTSNGVNVTSASNVFLRNTIIEANAASNIITAQPAIVSIDSCTIDGATGATSDGLEITNTAGVAAITAWNTLFTNNGRYGSGRVTTTVSPFIGDFNAYFGNATAATLNITLGPGSISGTDPQYTNATAGDFSIGTNLKALGSPGLFPGGLSTGYLDIGAVQRQEASSSGGAAIVNLWGA